MAAILPHNPGRCAAQHHREPTSRAVPDSAGAQASSVGADGHGRPFIIMLSIGVTSGPAESADPDIVLRRNDLLATQAHGLAQPSTLRVSRPTDR